MNILWIEDFGGLQAGKNILNQMFGELLSFDAWDNDLFSLKTEPADLNEFCTQQKSLHTIYLCRNYFDYVEFKENYRILNEIDAVIIDVRLDNGEHVDLDKNIPESYTDKSKFHENGGFYIFNDLIHLGIPAEIMCFMTGEKNSIDDFKEKCSSIYIPEMKAFEKKDAEYEKLRIWLKNQESDYVKLRRGIIEGCQSIKQWLKDNNTSKDDLLFNKVTSKKIEIDDANNYLDILESFFPLREPDDKAVVFKLFIRTLAHEWEAANPDKFKDLELERVMKITRNWSAHGHVFSQLNEQDVSYLFLINMRLMFIGLETPVINYEQHLFKLFVSAPEEKIKFNIPLAENYVALAKLNTSKKYFNFYDILNESQNKNLTSDNSLIKGLYQLFWFLTSTGRIEIIGDTHLNYQFNHFDYEKTEFLKSFSQHIYSRSFS